LANFNLKALRKIKTDNKIEETNEEEARIEKELAEIYKDNLGCIILSKNLLT
jgi:hypothetical protein